MWKKLLIILGILLAIFLLGIGWATYYFYPSAERVLQFIHKNRNKAAIHVIYNDEVIASQNADTIMPLASAVKTIIAIEFAYQAAYGMIDTTETIDTIDIDHYYVPETDGDAHPNWLNEMREKQFIKNGKIALYQVAKGMIQFSSNANSEYLMERLGLNRINARIDSLGITTHQPVYPFVAALFVCQNTQRKDHKAFENDLRTMNIDEYRAQCHLHHDSLKNNPRYKDGFVQTEMDMNIQKIWSQRLPGSTCKAYAQLMQKINRGNYFPEPVQAILNLLMQKKQHEDFKIRGGKGGSTAVVLTDAVYATDNQNNTTEMAVFFNNLTVIENIKLQMSLREFENSLMLDSAFRNTVINTLNP
jgi:D-alanyl-D-alanine carboxypeptidase